MQPIRPGDTPCTVLVDRSRMADPDPVGTEIFMDACMENRIGFFSLELGTVLIQLKFVDLGVVRG